MGDIKAQKYEERHKKLIKPHENSTWQIFTTGKPVYVSRNAFKNIKKMRKICNRNGWKLEISEYLMFRVLDARTKKVLFGGKDGASRFYTDSFLRANDMGR